ncbi:phosphatidate phosphatase LPIN3-like isoform X2 [Aplysia californica]|uniref:phosphatidate phosphatase n=1 Tax=Aplysia californica TaxID=6500 RepID=A0ABM1AA47_APLCA|nr:phosphatidate phosphatase LPIN3-like isoform X2 [Aplysia californica]
MSMSFGFVGKVFQGLKGLYNGINPATLTGAIDVVIIQQEDGTFLSSPFHVRFGKLGVLRSREKVVDIEINGESTDLQMKLGEAGEAFFVQEIESEEEDVPAYLATSPLPSAMHLMEKGMAELHQQTDSSEAVSGTGRVAPSESLLKVKDPRSDSSWDEAKASGRPRRKVLKKKKQKVAPGRGSIRSVSMPENVAEQEAMFEMEVTNSSDDEEVSQHMFVSLRSTSSPQIKDMGNVQGTTSHRRMSSLGNTSFVTPFSDPETSPIGSPVGSRPSTPKSDTEVDKQHTEENQTSVLMENSATWQWGQFPKNLEAVTACAESGEPLRKAGLEDAAQASGGFMSMWTAKPKSVPEKKSQAPEGIYLDDLASMDDPEMARIYLGRPREKEDDTESGRGQSLPQSPNSVEGAIGGPVSFTMSEVRHLGPVSLSLCGGLNDQEGISLDKFMQKVVTFEDLADHPNITLNPDLVVKIHDKYYNWSTAGPMVLSQIVFHKQLPEPAVKGLEKEHMPKKEKKKKKSSWFSWGRSAETEADIETGLPTTDSSEGLNSVTGSASTSTLTESSQMKDLSASMSPPDSPGHSASDSQRKHRTSETRLLSEENTSTETDTDASEKEPSKSPSPPTVSSDLSQHTEEVEIIRRHRSSTSDSFIEKTKRVKFIKTLRLSSEQVGKMNLKSGRNEVIFSVTTQYQGTTRCVSHVYLWHYSDKIVISDIDGTITKSDALGHIMPILGRDWSQSGVTELFTRINNNGYKLIYLSARAIGQSRSTKDMLRNIKQGNLVLPEGPIFLNPTSLFSAFHREVILKNPEEFKISCLKDIAALFPSSPFYAGFGNKVNDAIAYRELSIPNFRIFTINPQGQLRHDLSLTFLSSYSGMSDIVDHFFPSLDQVDRGTSLEYNPVNYWRDPIPCLTDDELALISETQQEKEKK